MLGTRGVATATVAGTLALSMVAGVSPASAVTELDPRFHWAKVPASVAGSLDEASAATRAAASGATTAKAAADVWRVPLTMSNVTKVSAVGGATASPLAVGAAGLAIGYEGGSWIMRMAGFEGAGTTALLDLYLPTAAPEFVPNADVVQAPPGWVGDPEVIASWWGCSTAATGGGCTSSYPKLDTEARVIDVVETRGTGGPTAYETTVQFTWAAAPNNLFTATGQPLYSTLYLRDAAWTISDAAFRIYAGNTVLNGGGGLKPATGRHAPGATTVTASEVLRNDVTRVELRQQDNVIAVYHTYTSPERPPESEADPLRAWEARWSCGGSTLTKRSASFRETDAQWPMFPEATCPAGTVPSWVEIWEVTIDGTVEDAVIVPRWTPNTAQQNWLGQFPQCVDGSCTLELHRVDPASGSKVSCLSNPAACVDWYTDPGKADKYQCTYAGQTVALDECRLYAPTFNVLTSTPVQTDNGPKPAQDYEPVGDPINGDPIPVTEPGGTTPTPSRPEGCPPSFNIAQGFGGFGYWVEKGVSCALAAAFVPRTLPQRVDTLKQSVETRTPMPELASVFAWLDGDDLPSGSACLVWGVNFPEPLGPLEFIDSCDTSQPVVGWLQGNRTLLELAIWVSALMPLAWWAWRQYAPGASGVA